MSGAGYWSIDVPGLDAGGAEVLVQAAAAIGSEFGASAVDPEYFYSRHFDKSSVAVLRAALSVATGSGALDADQRMVAAALIEDMEEWLVQR